MSSMPPPASSTAALRFSQTWRVCASISPMPAMLPSARRAVMPEMKTIRPRASIMVAWEKWPDGWRIFDEVICFFGMPLSSAVHDALLLISTRTLRYCQVLQLSSSWGMPGSRQITSPGFSCVSRTRPSSKLISFLPSVSGTIRYGSRCWCHGWRWPGSSVTLHTRTCSFSNRILSPIGPSLRVVAVSAAMIDLLSAAARRGVPDLLPIKVLRPRGAHRRDRGNVVVRPDQDQGVARTTHELTEAIADVEQRALPQPAVERGIAVRHHEVPQAGAVGGNGGAPPHVGEIERDEAVVDEIVQAHGAALRPVQQRVGNAVADAERPAVGLYHGPVARVVDAEPHPQHGPGRGVGPGRTRHRLHRGSLAGHVLARRFSHFAGALGGDRPLFARVAVAQAGARPAPRHPGEPPRQADGVENSGIEAERPHRRDQMRGIAHEKHAIAPPLVRDPMVDAVDDGVEDLHLVDGPDEADDLGAELCRRRLGHAGAERIEKAPAMRLAHQDHPFLRVGEIGEIGIVARIGHVEIDFDVDQEAADIGRFAFDRDAELRAHGAAPAVAGQQIGAFDLAWPLGRLEARDHAIGTLPKRGQAML